MPWRRWAALRHYADWRLGIKSDDLDPGEEDIEM